jgi:hypothetical protein
VPAASTRAVGVGDSSKCEKMLDQNEISPNEYARCAHEPRNAQVVENQEWHFEVHAQKY